ncbi:helix-turn-helix domain-containing protein [Pedobacter sp. MC2016-15]|jgi:DNA-binding HxlR family transcriptional regulator|uniref:winged helix-turn-helix transcriptional regulator n=1 Tax=Pedobacter sp. MC2016-15 TaxID=2994473 RepID=UPI002245FCFC|nr:helix-turn-helix domain-containing protein [Pedobacter sp. MC2016-15]MCX2481610.1 helix-turn-helix domain-containing protein [Pedobacter sp. MC2016-15]
MVSGGKWKPCLILNIHNGAKRPSELQRLNPLASRRVLHVQLKELEEHGIIRRIVYAVLPPKVEYLLTDLGKSLLPMILLLDDWGAQYLSKPEELPKLRKVI